MGTPLYNTDIIPLTSRPTLTVMDDGDYFVILDTSTGKISKILKTNIMTALKITYDNTTSGLTADTVQAALDELVVNLGSSDDAILALSGRLDTLEGTGAGSVKKAIDDALEPIENDIADLEGEGRTIETVKGNAEAISGHIEDTENPHEVTKTQVGLGNADNTSDANKPVSTAQQTALNLKEDKSNKVTAFQEEPTDTAYPSEKLVDTRFKVLEGTGEGSVAKAIDDALEPIEERLSGLDTLVYEGKTYMVSKRIENGHLVTTYTEVI